MATALSSAVVTFAEVETGASFTALTTMVTVTAAEVAWPSLTVKVNESVPSKFAFGV